jgi:2',3'-cyclic-nucleotide 2'-phosphodiesterase (5'-nucleotidase family)
MGGVARRSTVIDIYRANHPNVLVVNGGGWAMPGTASSQKVQSYFLCDIMGMLDYTAVNVTPVDLTYGVEALKQQAAKDKLTLVSANLVDKTTNQPVFKPYIVVNEKGIRVAFTGVMEEGEPLAPLTTEGDDLEILDPTGSLATLVPELKTKADVIVVFSHLTQRKTQQLVDDVKGIDIAISGKDGFLNYKPTEVGTDSTGKSLVLEAGERGKYLGALTFVVSENGKILRYNHEIHQLDKNVKDDSLVALKVLALKDTLKEERKREAVESVVGAAPAAAGAGAAASTKAAHEKYLGAQICARCHQAEFESWKNSPHFHSLSTLESKAMENSAECLKCHVTGYAKPTGFPNTSELGSISCEECHGQGTLHGDKTFVARPNAQSCTVCHDQKNSPHFEYKSYWAKIAHGSTAVGMVH